LLGTGACSFLLVVRWQSLVVVDGSIFTEEDMMPTCDCVSLGLFCFHTREKVGSASGCVWVSVGMGGGHLVVLQRCSKCKLDAIFARWGTFLTSATLYLRWRRLLSAIVDAIA